MARRKAGGTPGEAGHRYEDAPEPVFGKGDPDMSGPPFIVKGIDPASGRNPDADDRLVWLEKQQAALREWRSR